MIFDEIEKKSNSMLLDPQVWINSHKIELKIELTIEHEKSDLRADLNSDLRSDLIINQIFELNYDFNFFVPGNFIVRRIWRLFSDS